MSRGLTPAIPGGLIEQLLDGLAHLPQRYHLRRRRSSGHGLRFLPGLGPAANGGPSFETHLSDSARAVHAFCAQMTLSESLKRLGSIFLANDSFVFPNRVTQREPGMADGHNRGRSSQREFSAPKAWHW